MRDSNLRSLNAFQPTSFLSTPRNCALRWRPLALAALIFASLTGLQGCLAAAAAAGAGVGYAVGHDEGEDEAHEDITGEDAAHD